MAKSTVTFGEPIASTRVKRPWYELYPAAAQYVDTLISQFAERANGKPDDFALSVKGIVIPLERDSENPDMRAVRLINERAKASGTAVHATMRGGVIHLVNAAKVTRKRNRKPAAETVAA